MLSFPYQGEPLAGAPPPSLPPGATVVGGRSFLFAYSVAAVAQLQEDLRLPSLELKYLEGYAYLFRMVLPSLNANGKRVFSDPILNALFQLLTDRFGGCMVASSSSAPPLWGFWHPPLELEAEKDFPWVDSSPWRRGGLVRKCRQADAT